MKNCSREVFNSTKSTTIKQVISAITQRPRGADLLVDVNLDVYLDILEGSERNKAIAASLATEVLEYMLDHFLSLYTRHLYRYRSALSMVRLG